MIEPLAGRSTLAPNRQINKGTVVSLKPSTAPHRQYSEGCNGYVQRKKGRKLIGGDFHVFTQDTFATTHMGEFLFDIRYTLDNHLSQNLEKQRVFLYQIQTTAHRQTEDEVRPLILSRHHWPRTTTKTKQPLDMTTPTQTMKKYPHVWLIVRD